LSLENFTVTAWVNLKALSTQNLVARKADSPYKGWAFIIQDATQPRLSFDYFYGDGSSNTHNTPIGNTNLQINNWYHIAITVINGKSIRFYLNGNLDAERTLTQRFIYPDKSLLIGKSESGYYGGYTNGIIDEIRIYNHVLSAGEILAQYNGSIGAGNKADLNNDGIVDVQDLTIVAANFGKTPFDTRADTNNDGIVDIYDVVYVASRFGTTTPPPQCSGTCKTNTCNTYTSCTTTTGTCTTGYCCTGTCTTTPTCSGTCKTNTCSSYTSCSSASGTCTTGYCCTGTCTTPPSCSGTCKTNTCSSYTSCSSASGTCTTGYCCTGTCTTPGGNEIYAASLSPTDVQAAVNAADPGDTVVLPAGDYSGFNTIVEIPNGISMRGAGKTSTILRKTDTDEVPMLRWNYPKASSEYPIEISDLTIYGYPTVSVSRDTGIDIYSDDITDFKIHDIAVHNFGYCGIRLWGRSSGVIYNSDFIDNFYNHPTLGGLGYGINAIGHVAGDSVLGDSVWTDYPANTNPGWGTDDFVFIEDCTFSGNRHAVDATYGGRYVSRYNDFYGSPAGSYSAYINVHGRSPLDSQIFHGARAIEVYHNTITIDHDEDGIFLQSGDALVWDNTLTGTISGGHGILVTDAGCTHDSADYPAPDQIRNTYIWGNTQNGADVDSDVYPITNPGIGNFCTEWLVKNRDFFLMPKPNYTPYPYPHPLRSS
jgi:hypothetical protein